MEERREQSVSHLTPLLIVHSLLEDAHRPRPLLLVLLSVDRCIVTSVLDELELEFLKIAGRTYTRNGPLPSRRLLARIEVLDAAVRGVLLEHRALARVVPRGHRPVDDLLSGDLRAQLVDVLDVVLDEVLAQLLLLFEDRVQAVVLRQLGLALFFARLRLIHHADFCVRQVDHGHFVALLRDGLVVAERLYWDFGLNAAVLVLLAVCVE